MAIIEKMSYQAECDDCGERDFNGDYYPMWDSAEEAIDACQEYSEWTIKEDKLYCYHCYVPDWDDDDEIS